MGFRCCPPVRKSTGDPSRRVTRELTARERQILNAFLEAAAQLQGSVDVAQVRQLLNGGVESALGSLDTGGFVTSLESMVTAIQAEVAAGGTLGTQELPTSVRGSYRFDARDPRAIAFAQQRAGALIQQVTAEQRDILRGVLARSVENGWTVQQTAQDLRQVVGLHDRWATAVANGRLTELDRLLASGLDPEVAARRADQFADRYRDRLLRARAKNIARTEIMTASNQGRWLSWAQGVEGGYITPTATKKWTTGPLVTRSPSRIQVCPICSALRGEEVAWDQPFSNGVMMPPAHPSCRCTSVLVPLSIDEVRQRLRDADAGTQVAESPYGPGPNGTARTEDLVDFPQAQRGRIKERTDAMRETTQVIDRLHGVPSSTSRIELSLGGKTQTRGGSFSPLTRGPAPKRIRGESVNDYIQRRAEYMRQPLRARVKINDFSIEQQASVLTHELGHSVDWAVVGFRSRTAWASQEAKSLQARYGGSWLDHLDEIGDEETRLFCELGRHVRGAESVKTYLKDATVDYRLYFTSIEEVWARSYAQWVAQASGDARLVEAMAKAKATNYQFTDEEFALIAPIVERILRLRGLMK